MATIVKSDKSIDPDDDQDRDDDRREAREDREERDERRTTGGGPPGGMVAVAPSEGGFFQIYKKGQGYWTRMGTAAAAGLLIAGTAFFLYENLRVWFPYLQTHRGALLGI